MKPSWAKLLHLFDGGGGDHVRRICFSVDKDFSGGQKRSSQVYVGKGIYKGTGSSSVFQSTLLNVTMPASFLAVT